MPSPRLALLAFAALAQTLTTASVDAAPPNITSPHMEIAIDYVTGGHKVCVTGELRGGIPAIPPVWSFTVEGVRSDGTPEKYVNVISQLGMIDCHTVEKQGQPYGSYTVQLSYDGFGQNGTDDDVPLTIGGVGLWDPAKDTSVAMSH